MLSGAMWGTAVRQRLVGRQRETSRVLLNARPRGLGRDGGSSTRDVSRCRPTSRCRTAVPHTLCAYDFQARLTTRAR
jgi:hypothetical protein